MSDMFTVLTRRTCGWCNYGPDTWWDRLWHATKGQCSCWKTRVYIVISEFWTTTVPVWQLARKWHNRFHVKDES